MGLISWDKGSGRFYESGVDGPITNKEAFSRIRYNPQSERFIDDKGRFVPGWVARSAPEAERVTFARDESGNVNANLGIKYQTVDPGSLEGRIIRQNEQVTIRVVYRMPDGSVRETYVSGGLGNTVDLDDLIGTARQKADAEIRAAQGKTYLNNKGQAALDMKQFELEVEVQVVSITKL